MKEFSIDAEAIRKLAQLMEETDLTEIEIEEDTRRLRVSRGGQAIAAAPVAAPVAAAPVAAASVAESAPVASDAASHPGMVPAPIVGTVYLASEPSAANFAPVGKQVAEGDTLLIIEAMKVMNQIKAPRSGTVKQVLVSDAQPVEFGEPLLIIE